MEFAKLLKKIASILEGLNIDYCITGGYAVSIWGRPRSTFDIDVVVRLKTKNIAPLLQSLKSLSRAGYVEEATVKEASDKGGEFNFIHSESGIKVDFWVIKTGDIMGANELKRKVAKIIEGQKIFFISPEDLILMKLLWYKESGSARHLEDAQSILKFSKVDLRYLETWSQKQEIAEFLRKILSINNDL